MNQHNCVGHVRHLICRFSDNREAYKFNPFLRVERVYNVTAGSIGLNVAPGRGEADMNVVSPDIICLYMFRALCVHHEKVEIVLYSIWYHHQLDATLCRFYFCRVTLHVSGASAHHQEYLKLVQRPLVHCYRCRSVITSPY